MNVIITPNSIDRINDLEEPLTSSSIVFILYEPEEAVQVADLAMVYDSQAKIVFIQVDSRDDKLLCVGGIKVRTDCVILDDELKCSSEFMEKINGVFNLGKIGNLSSHRTSRQPGSGSGSGTSNFASRMSQNAAGGESSAHSIQQARKASEKQMSASARQQNPDMGLTRKSQLLQNVLGLKAEDVEFGFGTEALMQAILHCVETTSDDELLRQNIEDMEGGDLIWSRMQSRIDDIRDIVSK